MLQLHELEKIKANPDCMRRFLRSYDMQLNFYGVKVVDPATGASAFAPFLFSPPFLLLSLPDLSFLSSRSPSLPS